MSFFAGFAQGAMAAMPAATDRYVQARRRANERKQLVQDREEARKLQVEDRNALEKKDLMNEGSRLGISFTGNESSDEMRSRIADFVAVQRNAELTKQQGIDAAEAANRDLQNQVVQNNLEMQERQKDPRFKGTQNLLELGVPYGMLYNPDGSYAEGGIGQGRDFLAQKKREEKQNEINFGYGYEERQAQIESMRKRLEILQGESNNQLALDALSVYERNPTKANFDAAFKSYEDWAKASYKPPMSSSLQPAGEPTNSIGSSNNSRQFYQPSNLTVAMQRLEDAENQTRFYTLGRGVLDQVAPNAQGAIPLGDPSNARPNLMTSMEDSSSVTPSFSTGNTSGSASIDSLGGGDNLSRLDDDTIIDRALADDEAAIQEAERRGLFQ